MTSPPAQGVAVIATVLNEADNIERMLRSLMAQTRPPSEVVIVDAGSTDGTAETARRLAAEAPFPLRLIVSQGAGRSRGRNLAVQAATCPIIAATDAGCTAAPPWLERLVRPLENGEAEVASGFYEAHCETDLERVVGALTVPRASEVNPVAFLPSSRSVAFTKEAWAKAGGYPEQYRCAEDTLFDVRMKRAGCRFVFVGDALVRWRVHGTLGRLFRQFRAYALDDARAGFWWRHYLKAPAALALVVLLTPLLGVWRALASAAVLFLLYYLSKGMKAERRTGLGAKAIVMGMLVAAAIDMAHFLGFTEGLLARRRERATAPPASAA